MPSKVRFSLLILVLLLGVTGSARATPTGVTLSINQGDSRTNSDVVWLYLTASTTNPPLQVRFSNWGFGVSSAWEPYFQKKLWMLEPAGTLNATKGVTVEVKDATGTVTASDSIFVASPVNLAAVAQKRWYPTDITSGTIQLDTGKQPIGIAFDGKSMWVTCGLTNEVREYDPATGAFQRSLATDAGPVGVACAQFCMWTANYLHGSVRIRPLQENPPFVYSVSAPFPHPRHLCYDGTYMWTSSEDNQLHRFLETSSVDSGVIGNLPMGMAFDGNNLWVALYGDNVVKKIRPSDFAVLATYPVGANPYAVLFDGANIWVTNAGDGTVTKLRAADGANKGTFAVGQYPIDLVFDGATIWVANYNSSTISKLRAADGTPWGGLTLPGAPYRMAFDGVNVWVTVPSEDQVVRM
jgi:hypothetical protein